MLFRGYSLRMAIYEYQNADGQTIEIVGSMKNPPPCTVRVERTDPLVWREATEQEAADASSEVFERQFASVNISAPDYTVKARDKGGLPVSRASPRLRGGKPRNVGGHDMLEHDGGIITNKAGQPVIDSNQTARRVAKQTGMELD